MIKIIEKGKETFELTCVRCGCKFSYETDDVHGTYTDEMKVECPQCKYNNKHPRQDESAKKIEIVGEGTSNKPIDGEDYTDVLKKLLKEPHQSPYQSYYKDYANCRLSCDGYTFYETVLRSGKPYIGDSPCDWCWKRQVTCNSLNSTCVADQHREGTLTATNKVDKDND